MQQKLRFSSKKLIKTAVDSCSATMSEPAIPHLRVVSVAISTVPSIQLSLRHHVGAS
jgi:hypothetical protein